MGNLFFGLGEGDWELLVRGNAANLPGKVLNLVFTWCYVNYCRINQNFKFLAQSLLRLNWWQIRRQFDFSWRFLVWELENCLLHATVLLVGSYQTLKLVTYTYPTVICLGSSVPAVLICLGSSVPAVLICLGSDSLVGGGALGPCLLRFSSINNYISTAQN